ncbi:MAG: hypothetical protein ACI9FN_003715 [Saprospiraceae bacterium]|jgi:hypothetical protein
MDSAWSDDLVGEDTNVMRDGITNEKTLSAEYFVDLLFIGCTIMTKCDINTFV